MAIAGTCASGTQSIEILHSAIISAQRATFAPIAGDLAGPTADTFRMYNTFVDVDDPFPALGNTIAQCSLLTSPAGSSLDTCL